MSLPTGYENARLRADQLKPGMDVYSDGGKYRILKAQKIGNNFHVESKKTGEKTSRTEVLGDRDMSRFYSMSPENYKDRAEMTEAVLVDEILEKKGRDIPHLEKYFPGMKRLTKASGRRRKTRKTRRRGKRTTSKRV